MENFEEKLAEQKKADIIKLEEQEEKKKKENKRAPHLMNLNEDPQLSQHIYYAMQEFPVRIGRKSDEPKPQIIFGGISVHKNHGEFQMLDNGLIQLVLTCDKAHD